MGTPTPLIATVSEFLTTDQVAALVQADLVSPAAFRYVTVADLRAAPFHLSIGNASRVLDAANPPTSQAPLQVTVSAPETPARDKQIEAALHAVAADPSMLRPLLDLGVEHVVLTASDHVHVDLSLGLVAHLDSGGRLPATWLGHKIAEVRSLATPPVWCSPKPPHRELQAGVDEVSRVPWASLGIDGLRVAAHGYARGFFEGMTEAAAHSIIKTGSSTLYPVTKATIEGDMKSTGTRPESYDRDLFPATHSTALRDDETAPVVTGKMYNDLYNWLLIATDPGEQRRLIEFMPGDGDAMRHKLPSGGVTASEMTYAVVNLLKNYGYLSDPVARARLHDRLLALRPRRSAQIEAIFGRR